MEKFEEDICYYKLKFKEITNLFAVSRVFRIYDEIAGVRSLSMIDRKLL